MDRIPSGDSASGVKITVADFLEAGREKLALKLVSGGANLKRVIEEPIVNRLGLALTGFFVHFAWKRVQLIGKAEKAYLMSLDAATRRGRLEAVMAHKAFCLVYTNGQQPMADEIETAERAGAVLLASPLKTRVFAAECAFVLGDLAAPRTSLYGTTVEVGGIGVMLEGDPGLGKSETALGLVRRGASLVADDLTCIRKDAATGTLRCSASDSTAGFMEIRGLGIINIASIFGINSVRREMPLGLVITFRRLQDVKAEIDRVGQTVRKRTILGVEVPNVILPVSAGRDLVNLVETAAQQHKLVCSGYDAVAELSEKLRVRAERAAKEA